MSANNFINQRCNQLRQKIDRNLFFIDEYETKRDLSNDPKDKIRFEQEIEQQRKYLKVYQSEYEELGCPKIEQIVSTANTEFSIGNDQKNAKGLHQKESIVAIDRSGLLNILVNRFNDSELATLCFHLNVDYDDLDGSRKEDKVRELILFLERRQRVPDLLAFGLKYRLDIRWNEVVEKNVNLQALDLSTVNNNFSSRHVDAVILTILDEESQAIRRQITKLQSVYGSEENPNVFGWELGEIARIHEGSPYHVLLAQIAHAGNLMSLSTSLLTIIQWRPRYLFLVGIAGGLNRDGLSLGDVVVSDHIFGYEYGKILQGTAEFEPRSDFTYRCDTGLINGMRRFAQRNPDWGGAIYAPRPDNSTKIPQAFFGPMASGDKVIDEVSIGYFLSVVSKSPKLLAVEMEGVGAAAGVDQSRALGYNSGFVMVRGISDTPSSQTNLGGGTDQRNKWKAYAAEAAAVFVVSYITDGLPVPPS